MTVVQTRTFANKVKKLHKLQKQALDRAIKKIIAEPAIGQLKVGDLSGVRVHKFKVKGQQFLLAYQYEQELVILTLLALGSHENFYRDLKKS